MVKHKYTFHCPDCDADFERKWTRTTLERNNFSSVCPVCKSQAYKTIGRISVIFKGSGFYSTDSRSK